MWPASGPHARRKLSAVVLVLVRQSPQLAEPEPAQGALPVREQGEVPVQPLVRGAAVELGQPRVPPVPEQASEQRPLPHGEHRPPSARPRE
jgi:hypothetical protein